MRIAACLLISLFAGGAGAGELPERISRVLDGLSVSPDDVSILIEPVDSGETILSHHPDTARNPASVMKLVTTWSALELLGPAYTWPTEVYFLDGFDGTALHGDLAIKGYGDPFLVVEELWKMLRGLRRLGLVEIQGDVLLDDGHFDNHAPDPGEFDGQPYRTYNVTPSALLANFKAVRFQFFADDVNGRVRVETDPELENLQIRNRLRLVDGRCRAFQAGVSFNILDPERMSQVALEGDFARGCNGYGFSRTVLEHDTYLFGLFQTLWRDLGGRVRGEVRRGEVPEEANLVMTWRSPPLGEVIRSINKNSNNVMTRQLLLTIAAEHAGVPGTELNGVAIIHEFLRSEGLHDGSLRMLNGAGLSRDSRISARMLVDMLTAAAGRAYAPEFMASLSIAGVDGTTRNRFDSASGNGVMHVKSGRLDHVSALAGFAHGDDDATYALAIMMNATDAHRGLGQELEEAVLRWLHSQI